MGVPEVAMLRVSPTVPDEVVGIRLLVRIGFAPGPGTCGATATRSEGGAAAADSARGPDADGVRRRAYKPLRLEFWASTTIWPLSLIASARNRVQPLPLGIRLFRSLRA
jgi:hypothetical protein